MGVWGVVVNINRHNRVQGRGRGVGEQHKKTRNDAVEEKSTKVVRNRSTEK
jgi:hypothetical protein